MVYAVKEKIILLICIFIFIISGFFIYTMKNRYLYNINKEFQRIDLKIKKAETEWEMLCVMPETYSNIENGAQRCDDLFKIFNNMNDEKILELSKEIVDTNYKQKINDFIYIILSLFLFLSSICFLLYCIIHHKKKENEMKQDLFKPITGFKNKKI